MALAGRRLLLRLPRLWMLDKLTLAKLIVDKPVQKEIFELSASAAYLNMAGRKQLLLLN